MAVEAELFVRTGGTTSESGGKRHDGFVISNGGEMGGISNGGWDK